MANKEQVAVGLSFYEMLEWTFLRGEHLGGKIERMAFFKLQDRNPHIDYINKFDVTLHGISVEGDDCEVIFNVTGKGKV